MILEKFVAGIKRLWQRGAQAAGRLDEHSGGWLGITAAAFRELLKPDSAITAAAIAYFALFSLFPIVLVSISIASYRLTPLVTEQFILNKIEFIAPALGELLGPNIEHIVHSRGPVTIIALISLVWSASTVFNTLNQTLSDLWGYRRVRPIWKTRGLAILLVLVFAGPLLALLSFAGSALTAAVSLIPFQSPALTLMISLLAALLLNISLFLLLYSIFPHGSSSWQELLAGAIGAGILWELAKQAFLAFVSGYVSASNLVYGSVAAIIAFLTWAYLSGLIFLFGAYLSFSYFNKKQAPS